MKKGKSNKKKSPSREKYEKENPTVSARLPKKTRERLRIVLVKLGMSLADALKVLVGDLEVKTKPIDEARQEAYDKGWEDGIEAAEGLYAVSCPCSKCGKKKTVTDEDEKKAICRFMMANRWHHADCNDLYS